MKAFVRRTLLSLLTRATGRHSVLLPSLAAADSNLLTLRAPYRVEGRALAVDFSEVGPGQLSAALLGYEKHFPTRTLWMGDARSYDGPSRLSLDLATGQIRLGAESWGRVEVPLPGRRFSWRFHLVMSNGRRCERMTGHYLAIEDQQIGVEYYQGDNYANYEAQSAGDRNHIIELLQHHLAKGPVLDIGCATGSLLAELDSVGLPSVGVDISEWAVLRATERLGPGRAWVCDIEAGEIPVEVHARAPFGALVLWAVLEHLRRPFATLEVLTRLVAPGGVLVLNTTNAQSLCRFLFKRDWEGYFDWTHHGVEEVCATALRQRLPALGWEIRDLSTHLVWCGSSDSTHASLRDWWTSDARFRRLLAERDLGDLITCVAVRR